jgi:hypothetical protein
MSETSEKSGKGEKGFIKTPFLAFLALALSRGYGRGRLPCQIIYAVGCPLPAELTASPRPRVALLKVRICGPQV